MKYGIYYLSAVLIKEAFVYMLTYVSKLNKERQFGKSGKLGKSYILSSD